MGDVEQLAVVDEGADLDQECVLAEDATDDEIAAGNRLGDAIDINDDDDAGSVEGTTIAGDR